MARPPASPPPSDIGGVNRDERKVFPRGKPSDPDQQEKLAAASEGNAAWPDHQTDISPKENSR